ncbi:polysialyltransferase family glycosyltransferase [Streptomyces sp. NBC_01465]|uniref:polysialyltransferase family glycosyltransferase n=1 Tax=Streptomyces sp. NBC_01465 TaxID=2903878 RepID=UPI002E31BDA0|nr:polysialyltransferase family glycosyltransferase [Streptomyces sp. NBC_01465]
MSTTQIFCASTLYGAATLAAALDAGAFADADRRILLVSNNAGVPEITPSVDEMPGFEKLRGRFDSVLSWNETISPFHPGGWSPRADDCHLWERHLRLLWELGDDDIELALESIQVNPALAIAQIFTGVPVDIYADGLMSYGPTRSKIDPLVGSRIRRLLHLDLVPGLTPLLLTEFGVAPEIVPTDVFLKVLGEIGAGTPDLPELRGLPSGGAMLLGQYLSALSILTADEEEQLHVRMLRGAVAEGHQEIVFKPHPTAPARYSRALEEEADRLGVQLAVIEAPLLAEVLFERLRPALVVGCFSTALFTATEFYGLRAARTGTDLLLERLTPYQNSNRIPVTLADALLPDLEPGQLAGDRDGVPGLVTTIGFMMQPQIYPERRPEAEAYLTAHLAPRTQRYFKRRRLTSLGLPGGLPAQLAFLPRNATARRVVRQVRALRRTAQGKS